MNTKNWKKTSLLATVLLAASLLGACASDVKKVDLPADTTPGAAISNTQNRYDDAVKAGDEVLARKDMTQALSYLNDAKDLQKNNSEQAKIFDKIGYAQAYLTRATALSDARRPQVQGLIDARSAAVAAGAATLASTKETFRKNDEVFNDKIGDLTGNSKDVEDYKNLQANYSNLELQAIKTNNLQDAIDHIQKAKEEGASSKAPKSLAKAENSLSTADTVIAGDRHNSTVIAPAATKAKEDAAFLLQVMGLIKGRSIGEQAAIDLATTENSNKKLTQNLQDTKDEMKNQETENAAKEEALRGNLANARSQNQSLAKDKALNDALEHSRKEFKPEEAEAFIQGGKLVLRLKQINFSTGKSDLPSTSLASLAKVKTVIGQLGSDQIKVEGHTDSTGSEAMNQKLSEQRASAVATYFKSDMPDAKIDSAGYGDERPIANNKTKMGRAQNRRVDVIITPGSGSNHDNTQRQND